MSNTPAVLDMAAILEDRKNRVVVCCGAGGVGKTTTAASVALRAAEYGRTVVVLTIDPARRLAQSLGIEALGNTPQQVHIEGIKGELYAMMLDMRRTFDELVVQHAGSDRAQSILDNKFYQTVATSMSGTQEYMAMEKLGQLLDDRLDGPAGVDGRRHTVDPLGHGEGELGGQSDGDGLALSKRRITLSTSGVVPMIGRTGDEMGVMLAISLHAVRDELRERTEPSSPCASCTVA